MKKIFLLIAAILAASFIYVGEDYASDPCLICVNMGGYVSCEPSGSNFVGYHKCDALLTYCLLDNACSAQTPPPQPPPPEQDWCLYWDLDPYAPSLLKATFHIYWIESILGNLPTIRSVENDSVATIRLKLADVTGQASGNFHLRDAMFTIAVCEQGPEPNWAFGHGSGFNFWTEPISETEDRIVVCDYQNQQWNLNVDINVQSGQVLMTPITIGNEEYIMTMYIDRYTNEEWESQGLPMQETFWDDVHNNIVNPLNLGVFTATGICTP